MSAIRYRDSQGRIVDLATVPATRAKNEFGALLEQATHGGAVAITRHDRPRAVLVSFEEFQALVSARTPSLAGLDAQFDALLESMQTPAARAGVEAAFADSPADLGRAAVEAAAPAARERALRRRRTG